MEKFIFLTTHKEKSIMINHIKAFEATIQIIENKFSETLDYIRDQIDKAINNGKFNTTVLLSVDVHESIITYLKYHNYNVSILEKSDNIMAGDFDSIEINISWLNK